MVLALSIIILLFRDFFNKNGFVLSLLVIPDFLKILFIFLPGYACNFFLPGFP